ncbi:MAG: glycosyltransferase family 4 protein [Paludibacteraceae bacterium]|nr:glycosyltransferase family 4 protein [Paludibacteraceae bacterium]
MQNTQKHIVVFHLLNDFSGSPMILKTVLSGLIKKGCKIDLVTSKGGVLDSISASESFRRHYYSYNFSAKPIITLLRYTWAQLYTFLFSFRYLFANGTVFYINTLLPVGPAAAGWLMRKKVVYHYHENADVKGIVYRRLSRAMNFFASEIICVSDYQKSQLKSTRNVIVVPNAVSEQFSQMLHPDINRAFDTKNILMACSAKMYKGVGEFIEVAKRLPQYTFTLVLNCSQQEKTDFLNSNRLEIPENMTVHPRTAQMYNFYNTASIVLNLSDTSLFVETFGMTVAEALLAGLPCIVPPVGASREIIEEGVCGYAIDSHNTALIAEKIGYMLSDESVYRHMAGAAVNRSRLFNETNMIDSVYKVIC